MKQIETIKSVVLVLLIALSVTLTFSIWTYTPKYPMLEQQPTVDILIANKMDIGEVIKPYKLVFNFADGLRGTTESADIEQVVGELKNWTISGLAKKDENFDAEKLNSLSKRRNNFTLFFPTEIPLPVYEDIINIEDQDQNIQDSFNRITVEWNATNTMMDIHFISVENQLRYSGKAHILDSRSFNNLVIPNAKNYSSYTEISRGDSPSIVVSEQGIELIKNTYTQEEVIPSRFRDALFSDPNAVRRSQVGTNLERFQDNHAYMTINTLRKNLDYRPSVAKSNEYAIPSELLEDTFDFVNEHGGWTDHFRLSNMDPLNRSVKFQLHVDGLPVFSDSTSTEIEQVWGEEQIHRYMRPYYILGLPLPSEMETIHLPSGVIVFEMLKDSEEVDTDTVSEIMTGYYMKHDENLFMLEPSWFYKVKDHWNRFIPEQFGGEPIGLE